MSEQFDLPLKDADRALLKSVRVRVALRSFANNVGLKQLAALWGCDEGTVSAKIDERNRHRVNTHEWFAVFVADPCGAVFAAWCEQAGYERAERKQLPQSEADRLRAAMRDTLGAEIVELVERKAGIA